MLSILLLSQGWADSTDDHFSVDDPETQRIAKQEYEQGTIDFRAKRYRDALQRYMRVYRIKPYPNLVYNMARAFEELKEYGDAADYYERYLEMKPDAEDRQEVELSITTLRRMEKVGTTPDPAVSAGADRGINQRRVGWITIGTGGALLLGSVIFGVRAINLTSDLETLSRNGDRSQFRDVEQSRDVSALTSDIFTITGSVAVGVGLFFLLSPATSEATPPQASTSLHWGIGPRSVTLQGVF